MVRFINKDLKAHSHQEDESIEILMDKNCLRDLADLIIFHLEDFGGKSGELAHLLKKTTIQLGIVTPRNLVSWLTNITRLTKEVFLLIELILESYANNKYLEKHESLYVIDFIEDINEFFLIHKIPLQIRYFKNKKEFYIEKIISEEVSQKIKETLEVFSSDSKIFEDFKDAVKKYSSGDYEGSIEKCCISIEDYLCMVLGKKTCSSVSSYYKDVAKKLKIPTDLNDRFVNIISYIHSHRSHPKHGSQEKKEVEDLELVAGVIIQFTMVVLIYLKKKKEKIELEKK